MRPPVSDSPRARALRASEAHGDAEGGPAEASRSQAVQDAEVLLAEEARPPVMARPGRIDSRPSAG